MRYRTPVVLAGIVVLTTSLSHAALHRTLDVQIASQVRTSLPRPSAHRPTPAEIAREPVRDTTGLGSFLDSLQGDLDKGRLAFFLDHVEDGFNGHKLFCCGGGADQILRQDTAYARSTAQVLAWHLRKRKLVFQEPAEGYQVLAGRVCTAAVYPEFVGKKPKNPDSYSVFVESPAQPLLDTANGKQVGTVDAQ